MLGWFKKKFSKQDEETSDERFEDSAAPAEQSSLQMAQQGEEEHAEELTVSPEQPVAPAAADTVVQDCSAVLTCNDEVGPVVATEAPRAFDEEFPEKAKEREPQDGVLRKSANDSSPLEGDDAEEGDPPVPVNQAPSQNGSSRREGVIQAEDQPENRSMFQKLQDRLGKTRDAFVDRMDRLFLGKKEIDQDLFDQLEEILITADLGVTTTLALLDKARMQVKRDQLSDPQALKEILREQILQDIEASEKPAELVMPEEGPFVIMVVGVNGVGKTTTIGKVAAKFVQAGQSVLLVAGDTFRAAAINQLKIWGERVGVDVIAQKTGADPSSVVFDGLEAGLARKVDVILIDTAGRLHTSVNLMEELKKIKRVINKKVPGAPHEILLVLDATTGQNGISQAKLFHEAVDVTGLAMTKLDGTAKGGLVANICREIKIPVRFIGIGEQVDDLRDFDAREFVDALFVKQQ